MNDEDIHLLVQRVLAGDADAEQARRLASILADPGRRATAGRLARDEARLALAAHRALASRRSTRIRLRPALLAAAALIFAILTTLAIGLIGEREGEDPGGTGNAPVVTTGDGAVWDPAGRQLDLTAGGRAELRWGDGSRAFLHGPGRLTVVDGPGIDLGLAEGELQVDAAPQDPAHPLTVRCPDLSLHVLGTTFTVTTRDSRSRVAVGQGRVAVRHERKEHILNAGASWSPPWSWPLQGDSEGLILHGATVTDQGLLTGPGAWAELIGPPASIGLRSGSWSVAVRIRPAPMGGDSEAYRQIIGSYGWTCGLALHRDGRPLMQHFTHDRQPLGVIGPAPVASDSWTTLCGVVDRSTGRTRLYVDGALVAERSFDPAIPAFAYGSTPWRLGLSGPGAGDLTWPYSGLISEVRLWSRALDADEVPR